MLKFYDKLQHVFLFFLKKLLEEYVIQSAGIFFFYFSQFVFAWIKVLGYIEVFILRISQ